MITIRKLTSGEASAMLGAAVADAAAASVPMSIVVVDASGTPLAVTRMDGATPMTFEVGLSKARASAMSGIPTSAMASILKSMPELVSLPAFIGAGGGLPILHDGHCIGGIGASGGSVEQDEQAAGAGLATLAG